MSKNRKPIVSNRDMVIPGLPYTAENYDFLQCMFDVSAAIAAIFSEGESSMKSLRKLDARLEKLRAATKQLLDYGKRFP